MRSTVILLRERNGEYFVKCAGFFTSRDVIITAAHCVDEGQDVVPYMKQLGSEVEWAYVASIDEGGDVSALVSQSDSDRFIPVASCTPSAGRRIIMIGHPLGAVYAVSDGLSSGVRRHELVDGMPNYFLHHSAPSNGGNSGGPVITEDGSLAGVHSFHIVSNFHLFGFPVVTVKEAGAAYAASVSTVRRTLAMQELECK